MTTPDDKYTGGKSHNWDYTDENSKKLNAEGKPQGSKWTTSPGFLRNKPRWSRNLGWSITKINIGGVICLGGLHSPGEPELAKTFPETRKKNCPTWDRRKTGTVYNTGTAQKS